MRPGIVSKARYNGLLCNGVDQQESIRPRKSATRKAALQFRHRFRQSRRSGHRRRSICPHAAVKSGCPRRPFARQCRRKQARGGSLHDQIFIIIGRPPFRQASSRIIYPATHGLGRIKNAAVAAIAIQKIKFWENPVIAAPRSKQIKAALQGRRLLYRLHLYMIGPAIGSAKFAPAIIHILLMMCLQRRE